jgi:alpha-methylacyl-CoA racemase
MCALAIVSALYERDVHKHSPVEPKNKVIDCSMVEGAAYLSSWLWTSRDLPGVWADDSSDQVRGGSLLDGGK